MTKQVFRNLDGAFVHPKQDFGVHLVRHQAELKQIYAEMKDLMSSCPDYLVANPMPERRFDFGLFRRDFEAASLPSEIVAKISALKNRFCAIAKKEFAQPIRAQLAGVELSAAGRPMKKDNICKDEIKEAVQTAKEADVMVVSRNVYGQLTTDQKQELAEVDGAHAVAEFSNTRPKLNNPYGVWEHREVTLPRSPIVGGFICYHFNENAGKSILLPEVSDPFNVPFNFSGDLGKEFKLKAGSYVIRDGRLDYLGTEQQGLTVQKVDKLHTLLKPGPTDKKGFHVTIDKMGPIWYPVSKKFDGEFATLSVSSGRAKLHLRCGKKYEGEFDFPNCKMALEFGVFKKKPWFKFLYCSHYKGNSMPLTKEVQDEFWNRKHFTSISLGTEVYHEGGDDIAYDGVVIHFDSQQWFIKKKLTVDLRFEQLAELEELGYKFRKKPKATEWTTSYFTGVMEVEIDKIKKEIKPIRKRTDKYIGNSMDRILRTIENKTLAEVKATHEDCNCNLCTFD